MRVRIMGLVLAIVIVIQGTVSAIFLLYQRDAVHSTFDQVIERRLDAAEVRGSAPDPHLRRRIAECREKLPSKPAMALAARLEAAGGEPDATLAARLGMKKNTFLQNFTRARKLLRACLEAQGVDVEGELA